MANRYHSKSRSPPNAARRDACRLAQASSVSDLAQPDATALLPAPACSASHGELSSDSRQPPGPFLYAPGPPVVQSPFARLDTPTYRGDPPLPALVPVSGPAPPIHLANPDPFARSRIAAVQSRVAAPNLSDPRPPPPVPAFSPFRDGHYWCSKYPRSGALELGSVIVVVKPVRQGLPRWVTPSWAPLAHLRTARMQTWLTPKSTLRPA